MFEIIIRQHYWKCFEGKVFTNGYSFVNIFSYEKPATYMEATYYIYIYSIKSFDDAQITNHDIIHKLIIYATVYNSTIKVLSYLWYILHIGCAM